MSKSTPSVKRLRTIVETLDERIAGTCVSLSKEEGSLLSFVFHGILEDTNEFDSGVIDPQQKITVNMFREFVAHFRSKSYEFVSPKRIMEGLDPRGKYVLVTFDDGYYNNVKSLSILEEFRVPAVFFISTDNVLSGKAFWWDVLFREFKKRGKRPNETRFLARQYKRLKTEKIERLLTAEFGRESMQPVGDIDRPFNERELKKFAAHALVSLGNHTKNHAILSNYSGEEVKTQIQEAQDVLYEMTGQLPNIIAFPNGNYSDKIIGIAREVGLELGMGARPGKNRLPLYSGSKEAMSLRRFMLWGDRDIFRQCTVFRSDFSLYRTLVNFGRAQGAYSHG